MTIKTHTYDIFNTALQEIEAQFLKLQFKPDVDELSEEHGITYRGCHSNNKKFSMVVSYNNPTKAPYMHIRVYNESDMESVKNILEGLELSPIVMDDNPQFHRWNIDTYFKRE